MKTVPKDLKCKCGNKDWQLFQYYYQDYYTCKKCGATIQYLKKKQ